MAEETKIAIKIEEEAKPLKKLCEKLEETITSEFNKGVKQIDVMEMKEAIDMLKDLYEAKEKMVKGCYYKYVMEAMEKEEEEKKKKKEKGKEEDEDGEDWEDDGRRGYRGQPRDSMGRYMSRRGRRGKRGYEEPMMMYDEDWEEMERMRDMDKPDGKMYYSGGGSSGGMSGGSRGGLQGGGSMGGSMGGQGGSSSGGGSRGYSDGGNRGYSEGRQSEGGNYSSRNQQSSRSENARRGYEEAKMMNDNSPEGKKKALEGLENYMKELGEDMSELIGKMDAPEKAMLKNKLQLLVQKVV